LDAGTDPLDPASIPNLAAPCGGDDHDGDGLTCYQEYAQFGTNPYWWDTDGDGWSDGDEVAYGYDPLNAHCRPWNIGC
jgi:hypothetical protein